MSATATELNVMDAGATITTPTVAGGDAFVMDDADVGMRQVDIDNVDTYLSQTAVALTNKTSITVDNLNLNANTISSTDTDGDINYDTNGTGDHVFKVNTASVLKISLTGGNILIEGG
jgi:hypothetical protein